jgi:type VI protein secretion system component VasF
MTITIEIGGELQAELARRAAAQGMGIDAYAASLLEEVAHLPVVPDQPKPSPPAKDVVEAIERLESFGKTHGLSLGSMTIRELRHEARP